MRLRGPTRFLLACWALAGVSAGAAYILWTSADARLASLVKQCEEARAPLADEIRVREKSTGIVSTIPVGAYLPRAGAYELVEQADARVVVEIPGLGIVAFPRSMGTDRIEGAIRWYFGSVCEPRELRRLGDSVVGMARQIPDAQDQATRWADRALVVFVATAALGIVGLIPWSWYFFLARVRELAAAIRGEGPK